MKKFATLILALCMFIPGIISAQINETFENYTAGDQVAEQSTAEYWTTWSANPGSAEDPTVSNEAAFEGSNSMLITGTNDAVLLLGDQTSGAYQISLKIMIPTGYLGYYNILHAFAGSNSEWGTQLKFSDAGTLAIDAGLADAVIMNYNNNEWIAIDHVIDLNNDWAKIYVNGAMVVEWQWSTGTFGDPGLNQLSAMNFYAWTGTKEIKGAGKGTPKCFFDNITVEELALPIYQESFESYTAGSPMVQQAGDPWTTWSIAPGGTEDPLVTTDYAADGVNAFVVTGTNDAVLQLGNQTAGKYIINFDVLVPTGFFGYYNLLHAFAGSNSEWAAEVYFDANGAGHIDGGPGVVSFNYSYDQWVSVSHVIDLNSDLAEFYVNDVLVTSWQWSLITDGTGLNQLGAMNFYAWATNGSPKCYFDNFTIYSVGGPPAPANFQAVVNGQDVNLTWTAPNAGEEGFAVVRDGVIIAEIGTVTTYTDENVYFGPHIYDVKAIYDGAYSSGAGEVEINIEGGVPRDMVLLEIATGTWCQYCPGAAMGADEMVENGHDVAVVEYHGGDDYETTDGLARIEYYQVTGYPTAVVDGVLKKVGGSATVSLYESYLELYQQRANIPSVFDLSINVEHTSGTTYAVTVTATLVEDYPVSYMKMHLAYTQSNIAENWQGQTELDFVKRQMYPGSNGTSINFEVGVPVSHTFNVNVPYPIDDCELVAFLQSDLTHEVMQATKSDFTETQMFDLTFNVKDAAGAAISGATVVAGGQTATTNATGVAVVNVAEGTVNYSVTKAGYTTYTGSVAVTQNTSVDVTMQVDATTFDITFMVKDESNTALAGAEIAINGGTYTTGTEGAVLISLATGSYDYTVSLTGYADATGTINVTTDISVDVILTAVTGFNVTFNVDMNAVEGFDAGVDVVYISGVPSWIEPGQDANLMLADADNDLIYSITMNLTEGTKEFKFFRNATWTGGEWEGGSNRSFTVTGDAEYNAIFGQPGQTSVQNLTTEQIVLYPNPVNTTLFISNITNANVTIYNILGNEVMNIEKAGNSINVSSLAEGTYIVKIVDNKTTITRKININR